MTATPSLHPVGRAARVLIGLLARRGDEIVRDDRRLAPEMRAVLAVAKQVAPTNDRDVARARIDIRRSVMVGPPVPPGVHTWERDIPGPAGDVRVRVRFYRDADTEPGAPAICFFHGGGWVVGDLDSHDPPCRVLAQRTGAVVMAVDYRLAPEAPYPAAVEDCVAAYAWLTKHVGELGVDADRLAVMGDSAGGNLAVGACLALRESGEESRLRALLLNYPVLERESSEAAIRRYGGAGNMLTADEMEQFWRNYLNDERDADDPLVSPLRGDLRDLPPVLLVVPECDLLAEQSFEMADRLRSAQMPVELRLYQGATHSFLEAVAIAPLADRALDDAARWLRATLFGAAA